LVSASDVPEGPGDVICVNFVRNEFPIVWI
jgi:hypothetical protein